MKRRLKKAAGGKADIGHRWRLGASGHQTTTAIIRLMMSRNVGGNGEMITRKILLKGEIARYHHVVQRIAEID